MKKKTYKAHLTDDIVVEICRELSKGSKIKDISKKYQISRASISKIKSGKTHSEISSRFFSWCLDICHHLIMLGL